MRMMIGIPTPTAPTTIPMRKDTGSIGNSGGDRPSTWKNPVAGWIRAVITSMRKKKPPKIENDFSFSDCIIIHQDNFN